MTVKALAFAGSTRTGSINEKLTKAVISAMKQHDIEPTHITLADYELPLYDGDWEEKNGKPQALRKLAETINEHHIIFIATPEYNSAVTPLIKNTLDWLSRLSGEDIANPFHNRLFIVGSATPGGLGGIRALMNFRQILEVGLGAHVHPGMIMLPNAGDAFDDNGNIKQERSVKLMNSALQSAKDVAHKLYA